MHHHHHRRLTVVQAAKPHRFPNSGGCGQRRKSVYAAAQTERRYCSPCCQTMTSSLAADEVFKREPKHRTTLTTQLTMPQQNISVRCTTNIATIIMLPTKLNCFITQIQDVLNSKLFLNSKLTDLKERRYLSPARSLSVVEPVVW